MHNWAFSNSESQETLILIRLGLSYVINFFDGSYKRV